MVDSRPQSVSSNQELSLSSIKEDCRYRLNNSRWPIRACKKKLMEVFCKMNGFRLDLCLKGSKAGIYLGMYLGIWVLLPVAVLDVCGKTHDK